MKIMHSSTTLTQTPQFQLGNKPILRCNICLIVVNYEMPSSPWPGEKSSQVQHKRSTFAEKITKSRNAILHAR